MMGLPKTSDNKKAVMKPKIALVLVYVSALSAGKPVSVCARKLSMVRPIYFERVQDVMFDISRDERFLLSFLLLSSRKIGYFAVVVRRNLQECRTKVGR